MNHKVIGYLLSLMCFGLLAQGMHARSRRSFGYPRTYVKKTPCAGFGQRSSANGRIKVKRSSGHFKKTCKGYTYVNSYARSR
jgi:hypothetical protein